jgi:hypothetical protein
MTTQVSDVALPASTGEALGMLRAAMGYLAAAGARLLFSIIPNEQWYLVLPKIIL